MASRMTKSDRKPLALVAGVRTPFAKAFGPLADLPADELGRIALLAALERAGLKPSEVDEVVFGNVVGPAETSNIARVIALRAGVPEDRIAHTVNRNCASGMEAITTAWQSIAEGRAELVVAGGTESMSNIPLLWDRRMAKLLLELRKQKRWWGKLKVLSQMRPSYFKPVAAIELGLTDPVSGLMMGKTGEVLADEFAITREEQDRFALRSHERALAAQERCFLSGEIEPVHPSAESAPLKQDAGPRKGQTLEALAKLRPLFDPKTGTVTVGNACPVTDGAAAVVAMTPERARALGHEPLGYVRGYAYAGCDPRRMGLGPVFATAKLLEDTGLTLADFDLVEINEAFAVQVLACLKAMASDDFARKELGAARALGEIDPEHLNTNGGAIALGHPVGATGTRLVITLLRALRAAGLRRGLATLCVGGGQGAALLLETELDS